MEKSEAVSIRDDIRGVQPGDRVHVPHLGTFTVRHVYRDGVCFAERLGNTSFFYLELANAVVLPKS